MAWFSNGFYVIKDWLQELFCRHDIEIVGGFVVWFGKPNGTLAIKHCKKCGKVIDSFYYRSK